MMEQSIPEISFLKNKKTDIGFDILKLKPFFARQARLDPPFDQPHRVTFFNILFITKGTGHHMIDFQSYPYRENNLLFISKGQLQAFEMQPDTRGYLLLFTEACLLRHLSHLDEQYLHKLYNSHLFEPLLSLENNAQIHALFNEMYEEFHSQDVFARDEILQLLLRILLLKIERLRQPIAPTIKNNEWIRIFVSFKNQVASNYQQTRNAADYASQLGISYKYLNTICKAITGKTAKQLVDEHVVLEAKRFLVVSDVSVKELAFQMGFDEPTNFVKFFKKRAMKSPALFRLELDRIS